MWSSKLHEEQLNNYFMSQKEGVIIYRPDDAKDTQNNNNRI